MPGRKRAEIRGDGSRAELARRLRALRDRREMTLRQLAARSGYSQATLSGAEAGRRLPTWPVTVAFVQSCGEDPQHWRQLWELAAASPPDWAAADTDSADTEAADTDGDDIVDTVATLEGPAADLGAEPPTDKPADASTMRRVPRRMWLVAAAVAACGAAVAVSAAFMSGAHAAPHAAATTPPRSAPTFGSPTAAPSAPYPLRRFDTTTMNAGERITLDAPPGVPWPRATSGWVGYDLEFTLAQRQLVSVGTQTVGSSLAFIKQPTGSYPDCYTQDYAGVVLTDQIVPGTEFCVITNQRRRALIVVRAVHHDAAGLPDKVTLTIATWNHIVAPGS